MISLSLSLVVDNRYNATDIIVSDSSGRHLLVRVLDISLPSDVSSVSMVRFDSFNGWPRAMGHDPLGLLTQCGGIEQRLTVATRAVRPNLKLLLYVRPLIPLCMYIRLFYILNLS